MWFCVVSLILLEDLNATLLKYYLIMFADICMECEYCYKPQFFRMKPNRTVQELITHPATPSFILSLKSFPWKPSENSSVLIMKCFFSLPGACNKCCASLQHNLVYVAGLYYAWESGSKVVFANRIRAKPYLSVCLRRHFFFRLPTFPSASNVVSSLLREVTVVRLGCRN